MGCLYPHAGFDTGYLTDNGKSDLIIMPHGHGDLLEFTHANKIKRVSPGASFVFRDGHAYLHDPIPIPCGHCVGCRLERARQWKERICLEAEGYPAGSVLFATLTYDEEHLPLTEYGEPVLRKEDFQRWIKNIREHVGPRRYFACGEYGEHGRRPHFHAILFGGLPDLYPVGVNKYESKTCDLAWSLQGFTEIQVAEPGSFAYVAGYVEKKQSDPHWFEYPVKPFLLMSDRPGIGFKALDGFSFHDPHVYANFGKRYSSFLPQALLRKLEGAPGFDSYKAYLKERGKSSQYDKMNIYNTDSPLTLADLRELDLESVFQKYRRDKL